MPDKSTAVAQALFYASPAALFVCTPRVEIYASETYFSQPDTRLFLASALSPTELIPGQEIRTIDKANVSCLRIDATLYCISVDKCIEIA